MSDHGNAPLQFAHTDVELQQRETLYQGFFRLERLRLRHRRFAGGWTPWVERELLMRQPAVAVLPYDPDRHAVVLIVELRVGALEGTAPKSDRPQSPWLIEMIAGLREPGEAPEVAARREAAEEAGIVLGQIEPLYGYFPSAGGTNEWLQLFCARVDTSAVGGVHGVDGEGEDIRVRVVSVEQANQWLAEGTICNAASIIALLWLRLNEARLRAQWASA